MTAYIEGMTTKEAKFVKAKLENKSNTQAALEAVPNIKPSSAPKTGMRLSRSVHVQEALQTVLEKHNLNIDRTAQVIDDALDASKQNQFTGEINPDHTVRLKAADMLHGLMGLKGTKQEAPKESNNNPQSAKELAAALEHSDEIKLNQIIFNKKEDT